MPGINCPVDPKHHITLTEYSWDHPNHYDGVSEITCHDCQKRYGRWSKRELGERETEPPFGGDFAKR